MDPHAFPLFGHHVKVAVEFQFLGPGGVGAGPLPAVGLSEANIVKRYFCITANELQRSWEMGITVDALRTTAEGRWLFREFDSVRLTDAAAAARASAQPCACKPRG